MKPKTFGHLVSHILYEKRCVPLPVRRGRV